VHGTSESGQVQAVRRVPLSLLLLRRLPEEAPQGAQTGVRRGAGGGSGCQGRGARASHCGRRGRSCARRCRRRRWRWARARGHPQPIVPHGGPATAEDLPADVLARIFRKLLPEGHSESQTTRAWPPSMLDVEHYNASPFNPYTCDKTGADLPFKLYGQHINSYAEPSKDLTWHPVLSRFAAAATASATREALAAGAACRAWRAAAHAHCSPRHVAFCSISAAAGPPSPDKRAARHSGAAVSSSGAPRPAQAPPPQGVETLLVAGYVHLPFEAKRERALRRNLCHAHRCGRVDVGCALAD
jgi:hypothetical protein